MSKPCFQMKGGLFTLTVLHLFSSNLKEFEETLNAKIAESPDFFQQLPMIIDLGQLPEDTLHLDFNWLKNLLLNQGIIPVALLNTPEHLLNKAKASNWGIFPNIQPRYEKPKAEQSEPVKEVKPEVPAEKAESSVKMVTSHIRSGQQVYHTDGDLIIINTVNTGAEVLATGNIHIYGALRGRALAGVNGDTSARIFCQSLEAELISIAGKYKLLESIADEWYGKAVQIYLEDDELKIEHITKEL